MIIKFTYPEYVCLYSLRYEVSMSYYLTLIGDSLNTLQLSNYIDSLCS